MVRIKKIALLFAILLAVTSCDWLRSKLGMATSDEIEALKREQERVDAQKRHNDSIAKALEDSLAHVAAMELSEQSTIISSTHGTKRFHVIIGSFKNDSNTQRMLSRLKKAEYTPVLINFKNGFGVVSICSFDNVTDAFNEKNRFLNSEKEFVPEDIWVYDMNQRLHTN